MSRAPSSSARQRLSATCAALLWGAMTAAAAAADAPPPAAKPAAAPKNAQASALPDFSGLWGHAKGPMVITALKETDGMKPWVAAQVQKVRAANRAGTPMKSTITRCLPAGMPWFLSDAHGLQVLQTRDEVIFLGEQDHNIRHVYLNKTHPADLAPTWYGNAVGRWEGKVLVVDTVGISDKSTLDGAAPHSAALHVTERWELHADGVLEATVTADDPLALDKPWVFTKRYEKEDLAHIYEYACAENNHDG